MKGYVGTGSRLSKSGVLFSFLIHAMVFAVPVALIVAPPQRNLEKKIELVFDKAKPPDPEKPRPQPPPPKPDPARRLKPVEAASRPVERIEQPLSPIESEVAGEGGLDIPSGPAYEEIYKPPPESVCGNGKLEKGEQCDDGNTEGGDGCSAACAVERRERPAYVPRCGNGVRDPGEACDDGNTAGGDECSADCSREIDRKKIIGDYQRALFALIEKNKQYPPVARKRGIRGNVGVGFTILSDGSVRGLRVVRSCGQEILDGAALETIRKVSKFPPPPQDLGMAEMSVELSVVFKLN